MAKKKYKLTGFARFFLVMLILIPVAFFASLYINEGEQGIKDLFNDGDTTTIVDTNSSPKSKIKLEEENQLLRDSIRTLNLEVQEWKRQYRELKNESNN